MRAYKHMRLMEWHELWHFRLVFSGHEYTNIVFWAWILKFCLRKNHSPYDTDAKSFTLTRVVYGIMWMVPKTHPFCYGKWWMIIPEYFHIASLCFRDDLSLIKVLYSMVFKYFYPLCILLYIKDLLRIIMSK